MIFIHVDLILDMTIDIFVLQGTEVKAITYSNMQIFDKKTMNDIFVIIDI